MRTPGRSWFVGCFLVVALSSLPSVAHAQIAVEAQQSVLEYREKRKHGLLRLDEAYLIKLRNLRAELTSGGKTKDAEGVQRQIAVLENEVERLRSGETDPQKKPVVEFFSETNFSGKSFSITPPGKRIHGRAIEIGNDQVRSIRIPPGIRVTVFAADGFQGESKVFEADAQFLGPLDKQVSSVLVEELR